MHGHMHEVSSECDGLLSPCIRRGIFNMKRSGIRVTRTMVFKLALLVGVSIMVFSTFNLVFLYQRHRSRFFVMSTDRKVKLTSALEHSTRDLIISEQKPILVPVLNRFVDRNPDIAYLCIKGTRYVLASSAGKQCPQFKSKVELRRFREKSIRVYSVSDPDSDVRYIEVDNLLKSGNSVYGAVIVGFHDLDSLESERFRKLITLEQFTASSVAMLISQMSYDYVDRVAKDIMKADSNIRYVIITDSAFRVISHTDSSLKFKRLGDPVSRRAEKTGSYNPIVVQNIKVNNEEMMDVGTGLFEAGRRVGGIRIGYSLRSQRRFDALAAVQFTMIVGALALIALAVSVYIAKRISRPVTELSEAAIRIGEGDLDAKVAYTSGGDELRLLCESFNKMTDGLRERDFVKDTFSRYVTKQVADEILRNPDKIAPGGSLQEVTILFSDIRGFTAYAEGHSPEQVISHLNEYLSSMVDVIFKHEGTLDKFIGDAVMAVFGAPIKHGDDPVRAVRAALEMQSRLKALNENWVSQGRAPLTIGIGINTGEVIVGNIGDVRRMEYTVIGDNVNLASRIEGLTRNFDCPIIISAGTYEKVKNMVEVRMLGKTEIRGKAQTVEIFELLSMK